MCGWVTYAARLHKLVSLDIYIVVIIDEYMQNKTLHIILGNCLFNNIELFQIQDDNIILMIEDESLCTHFKYHKHKIILLLSTMREYKDNLNKKLKQNNIKATIEFIELQNKKPVQ
ncbi:MAG: cryptochrome/photolyase family protein [Candidatus Nanoarchaeia archaeon]